MNTSQQIQNVTGISTSIATRALATPMGVLIGQAPHSRKIICQATSDCFIDSGSADQYNQGIQGQYYSAPSDAIIIRLPDNLDDVAAVKDKFKSAIDINAELWEQQTGIQLANTRDGKIVFVGQGKTMLAMFAETYFGNDGNYSALLPMSRSDVTKMFKAEIDSLAKLSSSIDLIQSKVNALKHCEKLGINIPVTRVIRPESFEADLAAAQLPNDIKYIIKLDGYAAGIGNHTNNAQGYTVDQLAEAIHNLVLQGKVTGQFQVQEFLTGIPVGSVAFFDFDSNYRILSVHREVQKNMSFIGSLWTEDFQSEHIGEFNAIFAKLASDKDLTLAGPIGIDAVLTDQGQIKVIEINPRLTGASPLGFLLGKLPEIRTAISEPLFNIRHIQTDMAVNIPAEHIDQPGKIHRIITRVIEEHKKNNPELVKMGLIPMILPQGITPVAASKVIYVNDLNGELKAAFLDALNDA